MKGKIILISLGVILLLVIVIVVWFWMMSQKPFYQPGMVRREENLRAPLAPPAQPESSDTWLVENDIELARFAEGEGRNILVIHGGPGQPFIEPAAGLSLLAENYTVQYYAQRGCGQSTRPIDRFESKNMYENMQTLDQTLGLGAQIADIERIRRILGDDELILVGHSWGGFLASLYAAEFPDHVAALVLVSPANMLIMPQPEADSDLFASVRAKLPPDELEDYDAFMESYFDFNSLFTKSEADLIAMNDQFGEYYMKVMGVSESEMTAAVPEQGKPGGWMVWAQYISMGQKHDYSTALADLEVPVLVLHGAEDLQSEAVSRMYSDAFPNAEFSAIENVSHFVFEENPQAFADTVNAFLAGK